MRIFLRPRILLIFSLFLIISLIYYCYHKGQTAQWVPIKQGPVISAVYGLGTVTSDKIYHLKVGVTTHIKQIYVQEGDEVKAGQALIQLSNLPLIQAKFDGIITALPLHENETVYPQTEILTLVDLTQRYVLVSLEQEAAMKVQKGLKVKLTFSGLPNQTFDGVVHSIYPKDQEFYVKILAENLPKTVLPEMSADVAIIFEHRENALLVPYRAIQNSLLTIRRNGKTKKVAIELGVNDEDYTEIISNHIQAGDEVLVKV